MKNKTNHELHIDNHAIFSFLYNFSTFLNKEQLEKIEKCKKLNREMINERVEGGNSFSIDMFIAEICKEYGIE